MLKDTIANIAMQHLDFNNEELEQREEQHLAAYGNFLLAGINYTNATGGSVEFEDVANGVLGLASKFGVAVPGLDEAGIAEVKGFFNAQFDPSGDDENNTVETAGETLFDAAVTYIAFVKGHNTFVNDLLASTGE